eukprot:CAMPEP_0170553670 /NCGR_PEP_ID=MMETSP0211-20121228/11509_1 /TAXON_ID=311385 /ORGANISM="Pseudokeronopsis sp., Strain OXSARD2" /LENGTH=125 /DNA_ID=CAMNT_0010862159 /DNA_START=1 /DNA_END=378 /DNA_ORIENTATION=+
MALNALIVGEEPKALLAREHFIAEVHSIVIRLEFPFECTQLVVVVIEHELIPTGGNHFRVWMVLVVIALRGKLLFHQSSLQTEVNLLSFVVCHPKTANPVLTLEENVLGVVFARHQLLTLSEISH